MNFVYADLEKLGLARSDEIVYALAKLCGEQIRVSPRQAQRLEAALTSITFLGHEELNEILLIAGQDRVSKAFFDYFFRGQETDDPPRLKLRNGIIKFCGFAMLCYGNFRFAYRELSQLESDQFDTIVSEYDPVEGGRI